MSLGTFLAFRFCLKCQDFIYSRAYQGRLLRQDSGYISIKNDLLSINEKLLLTF